MKSIKNTISIGSLFDKKSEKSKQNLYFYLDKRKENQKYIILRLYKLIQMIENEEKIRCQRICDRIQVLRGLAVTPQLQRRKLLIDNLDLLHKTENIKQASSEKKILTSGTLPEKNRYKLEKHIEKILKEKGIDGVIQELMDSISENEEPPCLSNLEELIQISPEFKGEIRHVMYERERSKVYQLYQLQLYLYKYNQWYKRVLADILNRFKCFQKTKES